MSNMFRSALAGSLLLASPLVCGAQEPAPTFELLTEISIGAFGTVPTDIAFHDGDVFVSCFGSNRQIVRISGALTTSPQLSTFAVTSGPGALPTPDPLPDGPIDWASGRGLTSVTVNPANGNILVAGDATGTAAPPLAVLEYDNSGTLIRVVDVAEPPAAFIRLNVARYFGDGILAGSVNGGIFHLNSTLDAFVEPSNVLGWPNFTRGMAFVGDDIFIRTTSNAEDKIQRITGGTLGSLTGYDWEGFQFAEIGPQTFNTSSGLQAFNHAGTTDYIVANKSSTPIAVQFYDPSTPFENFPTTPVFSLTDADIGVGQLLALGFATSEDGQYMLLGRVDTPSTVNAIQIYGIDGAQLAEATVGELGDINIDGVINVADVTELGNLVAAGTPPENAVGDVNGDEAVNEADVQALADLIANP